MQKETHRIIIDTNLWISFLLTRDFSKLDLLLSTGKIILLISAELLAEIIAVAERGKFRKYFSLEDLTDLLTSLPQKAELVHCSSSVKVCRDEKDDFLLSLAMAGFATHLLTGDKDLLVLDPFEGVRILTIAEYLSANTP